MASKKKQGRVSRPESTVCIVCGNKVSGYSVQDDFVLSAIRKVKQKLGRSTGNTLVVCAADVKKAQEKRARFEKYAMWYGILAVALFFIMIFSSSSILSMFWGLLGAAFVLALSLTIYYPKAALPARTPESSGKGKEKEEKVQQAKTSRNASKKR